MTECDECGAFIQPTWVRCKICGHIPYREGMAARNVHRPPQIRATGVHKRDPQRVKIATVAAAVMVALVGMAGVLAGGQRNSAGAETPADVVVEADPGQSD